MQDYIIATVLGVASGLALNPIARLQVKKRTQDQNQLNFFKKPIFLLIWPLITALIFNALVHFVGPYSNLKTLEYTLYLLPLINIFAIDALIRKIPNELLLSILTVRLAFIIIQFIKNGFSIKLLFMSALGMLVAFFVFSIPARLGAFMGAGDVKFAGVIGFAFGFYDFFQAMVFMAVLVLFYLAYLLITKKGNLKTATPMGPYLVIGLVLTMLFPLSELLARLS
ncbi:MAG: prepilin peptidase [Clostridiales bacterium]|nr:prepilin peptidase [Clostridiales bacterium]